MKYFMDKFQRLLLANQFEILSQIDEGNRSYYENKIEILQEGYEIHYDDDIWNGFYEPLPKEDSRFVLDVLSMYRDINVSISNLNDSDRENIHSSDTFYRGFDFNDPKEAKLGYYAEFFITKLKRFQELVEDEKFDGFNSHHLMTSTYERYLDNYKEVKADANYDHGHLSVELLNQIFAY